MVFDRFKINIILRIISILLATFFLARQKDPSFITWLVFSVIIICLVINLIKYLDKTNKNFLNFLNSIKYDDLSSNYVSDPSTDKNLLNQEFNKVLDNMRSIRKEKEAERHYLKTIVQHIGIGLITFSTKGEVQIINTAAKRLFKIDQIKNIKSLEKLSPKLVESFFSLRTGGRDLVRINQNGEDVQLSIYAIELTLRGKAFKLISIHNIQSELEEKEMEAWQNIIRILTHEIMNSVTPISSLAATVEQEMLQYMKDSDRVCKIQKDDAQDLHMAVQTIQNRSKGLIRFVSDFRSLTHVPTPKLELVEVVDIFEQAVTLLQHDIHENNIKLLISVKPETLTINIDRELIMQVLINIIKNATYALDGIQNKIIELSGYQDEKCRAVIMIKDNGVGIEEEALKKIFIPFFTTKKIGSGIGLSLSKQIMRQHNGAISVQSKINEGAAFYLKF